ncbi:AraC family transcriptional regulator [Plasticicumulans lactativorans]|uniref:AraC family transcriptional regulator n=1 Tax=Plasticicumulans lactativorans TaxID=1133106 RepID=A0A4V2SDJ8_9GAMM|nr:helix-turn-helix transcriptional regulator [Plasticicumulans lactativorans]TCO83815.1 AraC family transcriptional regulator [Plasticicumulans lactativorans]
MSPTGQTAPERILPPFTVLPRPLYARSESAPAGSWVRPHRHDWVQLSYAISGVLEVRTAGGNFVAPPERAVWIPAGIEHAVIASERTEMRGLYLARDVTVWAPPRCRVLAVSPLVRELICAACALPVDYDEAGPAGRLVGVLLDQLAGLPEVALSLPLPVDPRLAAICAALQARPDDRRTLAQWAQGAGLSERTLARLFQRQTGLSFRDWRTRLRLLLALTALERGRSVTAVALESGYDSLSAFSAAFRRAFGTTPRGLFPRR